MEVHRGVAHRQIFREARRHGPLTWSAAIGVTLASVTPACGSRTQLDGTGEARALEASSSIVTSAPACDSPATVPTLLYEEPAGTIGPITLDGERIYWTGPRGDETQVARSLSKCGGTVTTLGGALDQGDLVLPFGGSAYWVDPRDRVVRVPNAGGAVTPVGISASSIAAVDATNVYGMTLQPSMLSSSLLAIPLAGGDPVVLGVPAWPDPVAIDESNVYFSVGADPYDAQLASVPKTGGTLQILSAIPRGELGEDMPSNIVLDDTRVYWASGQGVLVSVLKSGGGQIILAQARGSVAVDGTYAYFFTIGSPTPEVIVNRVLKGGGPTEPIADAGPLTEEIGSIAVDERSIYWTELQAVDVGTTSRILKLDL
jgi:hypothetical protein